MIESGMALFSIQLARLVVTIVTTDAAKDAYFLVSGIHEMLNVIIMINHCYVILLITWACLGYYTYHHLGASVNEIVFQWREFDDGS